MIEAPEPTEREADLDALRRRVYSPAATDADRERYRAALEAVQPEPPVPHLTEAEPDDPAPAIAPHRSRRTALVLGGSALAVGGLLLAVRSLQPAPTRSSPRATPTVLPFAETDLITIDTRRVTGPTAVADFVDGESAVGRRWRGRGDALLAFDGPEGSFEGGRVSVTFSAAGLTPALWAAVLLITRQDWSTQPFVMADGVAPGRLGSPAPTVFVYPTRPPDRLAVQAPSGTTWTLDVAVTDRIAPTLR